jgi:membrane-associated phospholipid phosphatase
MVLMGGISLSVAAASDQDSSGVSLGRDGMLFLRDGAAFFTAPLHYSGADWLRAGGVVGGTALLMTTDQWVTDHAGRPVDGDYSDDAWDVPTFYGSGACAFGLSFITYAVGYFGGNDEVRITGRLMVTSLTTAVITSSVAKFILGRSRPSTGDGPWKFNWFETDEAYNSMPSGHTTAAFAISTVLAERINTVWARIGFYGLATATGLARIRNDKHWTSDVFVGAMLGLTAGMSAVHREQERASGDLSGNRWEIQASPGGLTVLYWLR